MRSGSSTPGRPTAENDAHVVLDRVAMAYGEHVKHCVIVDKDINPFNLMDVFWAIAMRDRYAAAEPIARLDNDLGAFVP